MNTAGGTPTYNVFRHDPCTHMEAIPEATMVYGVQVDEGWRSWILCTNMYEQKAEELAEVLRASGHQWKGER